MQSKPLISVIVPTFNRLKSTLEAVACIDAQTWRPLELLVIDDGSTDGSTDQLQEMLHNRNSSGVETVFVRQQNQGPGAARNAGILRARGGFLAFLDSDDAWSEEKLARQMEVLAKFPESGACFTDTLCINCEGETVRALQKFGGVYPAISGIVPDAHLRQARSFCGYFISALLLRAHVARSIELFDPAISFSEDRDYCFRLSLVTQFSCLNEVLTHSDRSPSPVGSILRPWDRADVRLAGMQRMYEKWLSLPDPLPPALSMIIRQQLRSVHSQWSNQHLMCRSYKQARHASMRALQYSFSAPAFLKWALICSLPGFAARLVRQREQG